MKKLPLFVTLGLVSLMGACSLVSSETPSSEVNPTADNSVILESTEETTAEGINVEAQEPNWEAQADELPVEEVPLVDGSTAGELEDSTIGVEENPELEVDEINPAANGDVILPETDNVAVPTDAESAEVVEPVEDPAPVE